MRENVLDLISKQYNTFSRSNKIIAKYMLNNYDVIPLRTIMELKEEIGVSEATISRFPKLFGYKCYGDFQKDFEQYREKRSLSFEEIKNNLKNEDGNFLYTEISNCLDALNTLYSKELEENLKEASNLLHKSRKIVIFGSRTSRSPAIFLYYMLSEFSQNVYFLENINDDISFKLDGLDERDAFIAISYPKYTRLTFDIIKHLKKQNVKIISITDSKISPIAKHSDIVLEAKNSSKTFTVVSTITVINALVLYYANLDKEKSLCNFNQTNKTSNDLEIYLDDFEDNWSIHFIIYSKLF